jgi:hypothetical protein
MTAAFALMVRTVGYGWHEVAVRSTVHDLNRLRDRYAALGIPTYIHHHLRFGEQ